MLEDRKGIKINQIFSRSPGCLWVGLVLLITVSIIGFYTIKSFYTYGKLNLENVPASGGRTFGELMVDEYGETDINVLDCDYRQENVGDILPVNAPKASPTAVAINSTVGYYDKENSLLYVSVEDNSKPLKITEDTEIYDVDLNEVYCVQVVYDSVSEEIQYVRKSRASSTLSEDY